MSKPLLGRTVSAAVFCALTCFPAAAPADELTDTVTRLASVGRSHSPSFSPDGSKIAFVSDLAGVPQVFIVATAGGWPVQVTSGSDPVGRVAWSPRGDLLAYTLLPGGGLNAQIYLARTDGTRARRLTDGGKENNGFGEWSRDGRYLTVSSNRRNPAAFDAYLYDVTTGLLRSVGKSHGQTFITGLSSDGRRALLNRQVSRGDNNLYLLDLASKTETLLTAHTPPAEFHGALAPDGQRVYVASNDGREFSALGSLAANHQPPGTFQLLAERAGAELQSFVIDHAAAQAAVIWNVAGKSELAMVNLASGKAVAGPELPAEVVGVVEFSADDRLLSLVAQGSNRPGDVWVLDLRTQKLSQVTHSPHAGIDRAALVRPQLISFRAHDGLALSAWLYRPAGVTGPAPYVLSFHGGPEAQERPAFRADYQALLSQGIGVLAPNVRGSWGFGKKFVNLDNGALRVGAVADIKASVGFLLSSKLADPRRIGIVGGSYGGYMVMAGMTEYPQLFAAGVNMFGVVNFSTFFTHSEPWMAAISTIEYGDPRTQAKMLAGLSPIHKLDRIKGALMVQHGANDTNVPVIEAEQIVAGLKERGVPVTYVLYPDEGHGWRKPVNRIHSAVAMTRFFVSHLKRR